MLKTSTQARGPRRTTSVRPAAKKGTDAKEPRARLVELAVDYITKGIRDGRYAPGVRLVEAEVAAKSGLNIGPVREALRLLAGQGVVEILPYRGARIKTLTQEDLSLILEVLEGIGAVGIRLAAERCSSPQEHRAIKQAFDAISKAASGSTYEFLMELANFHFRLHELLGNPYLTDACNRFHLEHFHRELNRMITVEHVAAYAETYKRIAQLIIAGNGERASKLFVDHIIRMRELVGSGRAH